MATAPSRNLASGRLATAEWADPHAVEVNLAFKPGALWLGRSRTGREAPLGYRDDRHVCLVSGTRGGKGTTSIVNNLCLWSGSIVVLDPKGENATITATRRGSGYTHAKGMGQKVCVLDPFKASTVPDDARAQFNPLDALDPTREEAVDEAGRIADALVVINEESKDPFWDESARQLVKGLLLHVLTSPDYEGRRTLLTVRELITRGDWRMVRQLEDLKARGELGDENVASGQALLWESVRRNDAFYGVIAGIGETFRSMIESSPRQYESVIQVANRNTEFIDSPGMRDCLAASTFQLSELKTLPTGLSLYLCLPQRYMSTHYRWLRMMIDLTVTEMELVPGQPKSGAPVLMLLDEFAGLKRMKIIEDAVAQLAGFGVKMFLVLQTLEQLKAIYKDNWETFVSNSGLKVFFGIEDHFSREYVSKLIGETELMRELRTSNESTSTSESKARGTNWTESSGNSLSRSLGRTGGRSSSVSDSTSGGRSQSSSTSSGGSYGESYKRPGWLELAFRGLFGMGRNKREDTINEGRNWSNSQTTGTNEGWGRSRTSGTNEGWSDSSTEGTNTSRGRGGSETFTRGTSRSETRGLNESLHKRALITPDEIGRMFARVDDRRDPDYPGLALVLITGAAPAVVQKVNYYEDPAFLGLFDPHPDHQLVGPTPCAILGAPAHMLFLKFATTKLRSRWLVEVGEHVRQGQPIASITADKSASQEKPIELAMLAPYDGVITEAVRGRTT